MDYPALATTSLNLLTKFGADVTLVKVSEGVFDDDTQTVGNIETEITVKGVKLPVKGNEYEFGALVQANDEMALIDATNVINVSDLVIFASVIYRIKAVKTIAPSGVTVLNKLLITR
jgi:hypothetical protein